MTTITDQLVRAEQLETLWQGLFPDLESPGRGQFLRWADMGAETAAYALNRAARKALRMAATAEPMTAYDVARYVTAVMRDEIAGGER